MPAGYRNLEFRLDEAARQVFIRFLLVNESNGHWKQADTFAIGWQIYDPETAMFIVEGEWVSLSKDLAPAETADVEVTVQLPPEKGHYHVYLSARNERDGWFYQKGNRFLLIDSYVENGRARLEGGRVTTLSAMRRAKLRRNLGKIFTLPVLSVVRNWSLIRSMVRRDILARYRGSFGDMFWTVLNPLLLMATYFFVFGVVLQSRFPGDTSRAGFVLYFLAGMLPWLPFSEAIGRAPLIIVEHRNFVKKLVFPVEILPIDVTLAGFVTGAFALVLFVGFLFFERRAVPPTVAWLPLLILPQLFFTLGASWFLAALGVYLRDLNQVIGYLVTLWFFLTPICYPEASLPRAAINILNKNPFYILVRGYRAVLLEGHAPEFHSLWKLWVLSILVLFIGYAWFHKLRKSFADVI